MDAKPFLAEIALHLAKVGLEAVLIGNAGAALQGAPVTTVDFDFFFRRTPRNLSKLKAFAGALGATVLRPYYPVSDLYWRERMKRRPARAARLAALRRESDRALADAIRRWQALPAERRTHFLRKRVGFSATAA